MVATCRNSIHTFCRDKEEGHSWESTFAYGNLKFNERKFLWSKLELLCLDGTCSWMCIRDFNGIANQDEKIGLKPYHQHKINLFHDFLNNTSLMDMEVKGCRFTWASNPRNGVIIREKIDRMLANLS